MKYLKVIIICAIVALFSSGCKKFVELSPPDDRLTASTVYATNETATSVLNGLYIRIGETNNVISSYATTYLGLSADELKNYATNSSPYNILYENNLTPGNDIYWSTTFTLIYTCNAAIEGVQNSTTLNTDLKKQLIGEAEFMRALLYYYLVNSYGKVPLILTTDYRVNITAKRAEVSEVYMQIINDLKNAQSKLSKDYLNGNARTPYAAANAERVRPSYWAATALLARVYLYNQRWEEAEAAATIVLNNTSLYGLVAPAAAFLKNTRETIFALQPVITSNYALFDPRTFVLSTAVGTNANPFSVSPQLEAAFEINPITGAADLRKTNWTGTSLISGVTYRFPHKYKANTAALASGKPEYLILLRTAEQYLIRAEARAQQSNMSGAQADINTIRGRAGLGNTPAGDKLSLLDAVMKERQVELFCEQGHRWFDLKRTGRIDAVMNMVTPTKGGTWESYKQLFPVPSSEIALNSNLDQNFKYLP